MNTLGRKVRGGRASMALPPSTTHGGKGARADHVCTWQNRTCAPKTGGRVLTPTTTSAVPFEWAMLDVGGGE